MLQFEIVNQTPYSAEPLFLADEEGRETIVAVVKATFDLFPAGEPKRAEEQAPIDLEGEYVGERGASSLSYESDVALSKNGTDVVLIADAVASAPGTTSVDVSLRLGRIDKTVRVQGDRVWTQTLGMRTPTRPAKFDRIPIVWENAFGGWDRSHPDAARHQFDGRNPVGKGFHSKAGIFEEGASLPNIEDPRRPVKDYHEVAPVAGFGFVSAHWEDRKRFAGTYDETWSKTRAPLLPADFDRRFFNAAPADQVVEPSVVGGERVQVTNVCGSGPLAFPIPKLAPPRCELSDRKEGAESITTKLDTVVIDARRRKLVLVWRGSARLRSTLHDLKRVMFLERS